MPVKKDLKRLVRARMRKTGESYTAARAQLLKKPQRSATRPAASPAATASVRDFATVAGMSDAAVKAKTGCAWDRWVKALDHHGAASLPHGEIAALIHQQYELDGWWSQMVAVGYERIRGLRQRGQRRSGHFDAAKSKTFAVPAYAVFRALTAKAALGRWLPDAARVRTSVKGKSVRLGMKDGAIAAFFLTPKGERKTAVAVQQEKLPDAAARDQVRRYWTERLAALGKELGGA